MPSLTVCLASFHVSYDMYTLTGLSFNNIYQQWGDAKNPYFAQYSADVWENAPVITSWTNMKINILIKNILKPLNTHFNTFLIELFVVIVDNILPLYCLLFYIIIIKHAVSEMRLQNLLVNCRHLITVIFKTKIMR
jgi:hypothetical protein